MAAKIIIPMDGAVSASWRAFEEKSVPNGQALAHSAHSGACSSTALPSAAGLAHARVLVQREGFGKGHRRLGRLIGVLWEPAEQHSRTAWSTTPRSPTAASYRTWSTLRGQSGRADVGQEKASASVGRGPIFSCKLAVRPATLAPVEAPPFVLPSCSLRTPRCCTLPGGAALCRGPRGPLTPCP